uniref:Uncharacterized protein n=1 Tax=Myotis myotis TaxID=51298 RepID=A0A7J7XHT9_MYOMY|nr:hypothetical protein mMyoMyo1_011801 [Myotis myotis]
MESWSLPGCSLHPAPRPAMLGVSIAASVGVARGALGNSLVSAQDFNDKLQLALESNTASLASLQWQVISAAQVALQNQHASDLLTAEKGGTCIFLQEECCYYIDESGVVEQNVQKNYMQDTPGTTLFSAGSKAP